MRGVALTLSCALTTLLVLALAGSARWTEWVTVYPLLRVAPIQILALATALGLVFHQSRVAGLAMALSAIHLRAMAFSTSPTGPISDTQANFILLASVSLPAFSVVFHWWEERYLFSVRGSLYALAMAGVAILLYFLPATGLGAGLARPLDGLRWLVGWLPTAGLLALLVSAALLLWPRPHDPSPGGALFLLAAFCNQAMLVSPLLPWERFDARVLMPAFSLASALTLVWAILDAAWRHANLDELTGLPGRRPLRHHLAALGSSYSIAIVDIDHFKRINDFYGHAVGDQVLRFVATTLRGNRAGRVYRSGGEEFTILCTRGDSRDHVTALEDLRREVEKKRFVLRSWKRPPRKPAEDERPPRREVKQSSIELTVSIGVATSSGAPGAHPQDTLKAADEAMYRAKESGRNRMCRA
jgi:GGDEF domain-containing protein